MNDVKNCPDARTKALRQGIGIGTEIQRSSYRANVSASWFSFDSNGAQSAFNSVAVFGSAPGLCGACLASLTASTIPLTTGSMNCVSESAEGTEFWGAAAKVESTSIALEEAKFEVELVGGGDRGEIAGEERCAGTEACEKTGEPAEETVSAGVGSRWCTFILV